MTRPAKVYCFFEQSGTFKNAFREIGIPAEDYDIQNNFGETDHVLDLFAEIEAAYDGRASVFDVIGGGDLSMAFFPCVYFCQQNETFFNGTSINLRGCTLRQKTDCILARSREREKYYEMALKMFLLFDERGRRLIVENPWTSPHYLHRNFPYTPALIDNDRRRRGDYFRKPTQYWFVNCAPTHGRSFNATNVTKTVNGLSGHKGSICDEARSMISPVYARSFIADFILGEPIGNRPQQQELPL